MGITRNAREHASNVLAALPGTNEAISLATGRSVASTKNRLTIMRRQGQCYIGAWQRCEGKGGMYQPIYFAGEGKDAPCLLKRMSMKKYSERYRKKIKGTDAHERRKAHDRAKHWLRKAMNEGDPLVNALFGKPAERRA